MININVFVAGSKKLREHRDRLTIWANKKNYDYRRRNEDIEINIVSFREVGDDQDEYNHAICEQSDIVLFIVDGYLGDRTKEELTKARETRHNSSDKRPLIWVFVANADNEIISYLEGALGRKYAIDFNSVEELVRLFNERIDRFVNDIPKPELPAVDVPTINYKRYVKYGIAALFIIIIVFCGGWWSGYCATSNNVTRIESNKMLLIAGGGSVANFIEEQPNTKISALADYPNGYFVHLPTKSAWKMLVEEVVSLQDAIRYYPICISAAEATDEDFCNAQISQQMFLDSAIVVSAKLGEDSLAVYIQKNSKFIEENPKCLLDKHISVEQLKELIFSKGLNVYSTSVESGTRAGFCKVLGIDNNQIGEFLAGQFSEYSPLSSVSLGKKSYLLLGSKYYGMNATKNDAIRLTVQSDYVKPMMVYFMAYRAFGDTYKIPQETIEFLNHLNLHALDNYISSDGSIKIKNHDHVIYDENYLIENSSKQ